MAKTSKIYLAKNIKLDKNYKSVLNYSESQMLDLISNNLVYSNTSYQFIRESNIIQVKAPYSLVCGANYMAFQNPDYSNKYFFAFIDEVKYLNENATEIRYTIDIWTTWYDYWSAKACFTVREHVIDDTIGANTVPEDVELGDYVSAGTPVKALEKPNDFIICMAVSELPDSSFTPNNTRIFNGLYNGFIFLAFASASDCTTVIKWYSEAGKLDSIYSLFMIPKLMTSVIDGTNNQWTRGEETITVTYLANSNDADLVTVIGGTMPTKLGESYVPKNKKLFTFPYSFMNLANNSGATQQYKYEDFNKFDEKTGDRIIGFWIYGIITIGMSMKAVPIQYKNLSFNYDEGLMLGKLPVCSWLGDSFTNWLTQNSLNIGMSSISSILQVAGGISLSKADPGALAGAGQVASGATSIAGTIGQIYQHALAPKQVDGNINAGDINFSVEDDGGLTLYYISIKDEWAKRIDDYFTRMGYKVNNVKVPNMSNRENYNYVQIASEENVAYSNNHNNICLPATALNDINNIFRSGVTIWNNHANFGDYSVSNNITN